MASTSTITVISASRSSSSDAAPAASSSSSSGGGVLTTTAASSLYLYTFLATLVLLLTVSAAVIVRSIAIRRRQRRAIEEAIRNGTYVSPEQRRRMRHERPKMYEVLIHEFDSSWEKWPSVLPVAAGVAKSSLPASTMRIVRRRRPWNTRCCFDFDPFEFFIGAKPEGVSKEYTTEVIEPDYKEVPLNVSVLIAMPAPNRTELRGSYNVAADGEGEMPVVEIGMAKLTVVPGKRPKGVSGSSASTSGSAEDSAV